MAKDRDTRSESEASSGEEEESEYESESEPEPEPERTQAAPQATVPLPQKARSGSPVVAQKQDSSSEEETDSESSSDSEETSQELPPPTPKPAESVHKRSSTQKADSSVSEQRTPARKAAGTKRGAEEKGLSAKDVKKAKKKSEPSESKPAESSKKLADSDTVPDSRKLFQRIWSEDDEVVVLRGMVDYMETNKVDPNSELDSFFDFIKGKLQADVSRSQLQNKIRTLKKKFQNNKSKEVDGEERVFSKPLENTSYLLSKKIWGKENADSSIASPNSTLRSSRKPSAKSQKKTAAGATAPVANPKQDKVPNGVQKIELDPVETTSKDVDMMPPSRNWVSGSQSVNMEEMVLKIGSEIFEQGDKVVEGSKEWNILILRELELHGKSLQIKMDRTKLVMDALKSRNASN